MRANGIRLGAFLVAGLLLPAIAFSAEEKVLVFPDGQRIGSVVTRAQPTRRQGFFQPGAELGRQPAVGRVVVPSDRFVCVELPGDSFRESAQRERLDLNAVDSLLVSGNLAGPQLRWIASLTSLVELRLMNVSFDEGAFDNLQGLPKVVTLTLYREGQSGLSKGFARWVAQMPSLEFLYTQPFLGYDDFVEIEGHPRLAFVNVNVGPGEEGVFESLSRLPALTGLNLTLPKEGERVALAGLERLTALRVINWNDSLANGDAVRHLSKLPELRAIRFQGQVRLGRDFARALPELKSLEELRIQPTYEAPTMEVVGQLPVAMARMPRLSRWPELRNVSAETLQQIAAAEQLESLEIRGVSSDVTAETLASWDVSRLTKLKYLELEGVSVDDRWLRGLSGARSLEMLRLGGTRVTGAGLDALSGLKLLQTFGLQVGKGVAVDFGPLSRLSAVRSIELSGNLLPKDLDQLRFCKSLETLRVWDGISDDSTAGWLSEMQSLESLDLGDMCFMSDLGAAMLARLPRLHSLTIGGPISREGVALLGKSQSLVRLNVHSTMLDQSDLERLRQAVPGVISLDVRKYLGSVEVVERRLLGRP